MKKITCLVLVLALLCSFAGCGTNKLGMSKADVKKYGERSRSFTFSYFDGGFSSKWIQAVTEDYMLNVNKDVYISLKPNTDNENTREKIVSRVGIEDLYFLEVDMFDKANVLEELSDVLDAQVYGEDGKVRDKIPQQWLDYYTEDGKCYQLSATNFMGWNWTYNKTLLDKTFGAGQYKLPNTTDELFAFGDKLFDKNIFLTTYAGQDMNGGADYLRYAFETWFAQILGKDGYDHYFNCEYMDGNTYKLATDSPKNIADCKNAITANYQIAQTLCQGRNNVEYIHSKCNGLNFLEAQFLLYQGKVRGSKEYPIAFYYNAASGRSEMAGYADQVDLNQEICVMKMPVASAITQRTKTINDDKTLSAVVDFVDGAAAKAPAGVSETDIAAVREARNMMAELVCREFVVPSDGKNKDDVKAFLAYLASDRAQQIAAKSCGGLPVLNFGYVPTDADITGSEADKVFVRGILDQMKSAVYIDIAKFDKVSKKAGIGLEWYKDGSTSGGTLCVNLYTKQALTADKIYDSTYKAYANTWKDRMEQYALRNKK